MAGLAEGRGTTGVERGSHWRFARAACADYAPWLRVSIAALAVLALLILLSAPAARGATSAYGDQFRAAGVMGTSTLDDAGTAKYLR